MIVQHNLTAINAHRMLGINSKKTSDNLEKLASGFHTNRAADDAAGLAISEKMRGQIRGLSMAEMNVQHGISMIQTAEGGAREIHSILQRMRELSVQSSNGTYQDGDRKQLDKEFQALKSEVTRIAESTHFNGIRMLVPEHTTVTETTDSRVTVTDAVEARKLLGWPPRSEPMPNSNLSFRIRLTDGPPNPVMELTFERNASGAWTLAIEGDYSSGGPVAISDGVIIDLYSNNDQYIHIDIYAQALENINASADSTVISGKLVYEFRPSFLSGTIPMYSSSNGTSGNSSSYMLKSGSVVLDGGEEINEALYPNPVILQIGANGGADRQLSVNRFDLRCSNLGEGNAKLSGSDIATRENANRSIGIMDESINQISSARAYFGATQNRLEHTLNNLEVAKENLTAAESTIRDVDVAKEMMEFTKNNILGQAAQAMLAQVNQLPQGILGLLQ